MSDSASIWTPRLPVTDATLGTGPGGVPGVTATVRDGLGLATVMARKGAASALAERVRTRFGLELPAGPCLAGSAEVSFVGTGPGAWLAVADRGGNELAGALARELDGLAAVADQSDGYFVLRLTGPRARDTLAKLIPVDLHPRAFRVAGAATTVAAHMGVTLWRHEDGPGATPVFEMALFRSLAGSFWHALAEAGAEFGFAGRAALG